MKVTFINGRADEFKIVKDFMKENPEISIKSNGLKNARYSEFNVYFEGRKVAIIRANIENGLTKPKVEKLIRQLKGVKELINRIKPKVEEVEFDI